MGYRGVVKPGGASNLIVMEQLNAQRGRDFSDSDFSRSGRYVVEISPTESGDLSEH
jgi:hypothetical protein